MKHKIEPKSNVSVSQQADKMLLEERFVEAEELYSKLVSGLTELLGSQHPEVGKALHKLAAALAAQNKLNEAKTVEDQAEMVKAIIQV